MGAVQQTRGQKREAIQDWTDILMTEQKRAGFIAVTDFKEQTFYNSDERAKMKAATKGKQDVYMSINAFGYNSSRRLNRQTKHLKQIRNIAIDIDQYKLNLKIDETLDIIQSLVVDGTIPEPNLVLTSRGIQLFYTINRGAAPEMAWLAGYITEKIVMKLEHVGADHNAKDMSRVMRIPETINSRNGATVEWQIWNDRAYSLQDLQEYAPVHSFNTGLQTDVIRFPNGLIARFHRTNYLRQEDLRKLVELRGGNLTGCRNTFVYILAYQQALILQTNDYKKLLNFIKADTKEVYTTDPKAESMENWLEHTVKSAHKSATEFMDHLNKRHTVKFEKNDGIIKPYKTENIINKLGISEVEQQHLNTLVNEDIRKERDRQRKEGERRKQGVKSSKEYNASRQAKKQAQMHRIVELKQQGMKQQAIAIELNISKSRVSQLLKEYKESVKHG